MEEKSSNRRSFVRRLLGLAALGGVAGILHARGTPSVKGADGDNVRVGYTHTGTNPGATTEITGHVPGLAALTISNAKSDTDSAAIRGTAFTSSGTVYGVIGETWSASGVGVMGKAIHNSAKPIVARGYGSQIANLQEWQNIVGTALSVIDKNGKLGIGTSSPSFMLHIISGVTGPLTAASAPGAGPAPNSFICENLTSGNAKSQFTFRASGVNKYSFGNDIAGTGGQNFFIWDEVGAEAALYIDSNRRVGLGTLSPTEKLHVAGNVKAASFITGDVEFANGYRLTEDRKSGMLLLNEDGQRIARFDHNGNLHIKGDVIKDL